MSSPNLAVLPILFQVACQRKAKRAKIEPGGVAGLIIGTWPGIAGGARGRASVGLYGVLTAGIMVCGAWATGVEWKGQPPAGEPARASTGASTDNSGTVLSGAPDAEAVLKSANMVSEWVGGWKVPAEKPTGLVVTPAATVTLRLLGDVVGRGQDSTGDDSTLWRATERALAEASKRLPFENDALSDVRRAEAARTMSISIEVAGALVPLRAETYDDVDAGVPVGICGVAGRLGERVEFAFPAGMLGGTGGPGESAAGIVGRLLRDPAKGIRIDERSQPKVVAEQGVKLYRFDVQHVFKSSPSDAGRFLYRGGRIVDVGTLNAAGLRDFADGVAAHLITRRWPGKERFGVRGAFDPVRGVHEPAIAPPPEQALVAFALRRHGALEDGEPCKSSRLAADQVVVDLAMVTEREESPWSTARGAALLVAAASEGAKGGASRLDNPEFVEAAAAARAVEQCAEALRVDGAGEDALRALALASGGARGDAATGRGAAGALVSNVLADSTAASLASSMPWIFLADRAAGGGEIDPLHAGRYREFRELAYQLVLRAEDAGDEGRDLVGGLILAGGGRASLPSAQSARIVAGLAAMLNDASVTPPQERARELVRLLPCMRFLRQLAAGPETSPLLKEGSRTTWGIRSAVWDPRMPGEASALTLMAVSETLDALRLMAAPARPSEPTAEAGPGK